MNFSRREKLLLIVVLAVVAALGVDRMIVRPYVRAWQRTSEQIEKHRTRIARMRRQLADMGSLQRRWKQIERLARQADGDESAQRSRLDKFLHALAEQAGVVYRAVSPQRPRRRYKHLGKVAMQVEFNASYRQLCVFLGKLQTAPMLVQLTRITINNKDPRSDRLYVSAIITAAYFNAEGG